MAPKKVIHVSTVDMSLELLLGPQLHAFAAAGYEVVGASAPGPYSERLEASGIRHIPLQNSTRSMNVGRDLKYMRELYGVLRRERPDIVHLHNPKPGWFGRPTAAAARVPGIVNTVHGLYASPDDSLLLRTIVYSLERFAALWSDRELVQNPEDVTLLRRLRVPAKKLVTLGNGIDLTRFSASSVDPAAVARCREGWGATADRVIVGTVGRLVWEKGLKEIFAAAELLRSRVPEAMIVVVGPLDPEKSDGLTAADLEEIHQRTGVVFAGERSDMDVVYGAFDVFMLASHREGFPRAAMEASALGLPVIATDIRGCRQVVDDGVTGLLFPVTDAAALADAVALVVGDADLRSQMGAAAQRKAVAEFDQQRVIDITLRVYGQLLNGS